MAKRGKPIRISYDSVADVLYLSLGTPDRPVRYHDGPDGVVWRLAPDGEARGATVQDFNTLLGSRVGDLISLLSARLDLSQQTLREQVAEFAD
jgi:hypothetical protein